MLSFNWYYITAQAFTHIRYDRSIERLEKIANSEENNYTPVSGDMLALIKAGIV